MQTLIDLPEPKEYWFICYKGKDNWLYSSITDIHPFKWIARSEGDYELLSFKKLSKQDIKVAQELHLI